MEESADAAGPTDETERSARRLAEVQALDAEQHQTCGDAASCNLQDCGFVDASFKTGRRCKHVSGSMTSGEILLHSLYFHDNARCIFQLGLHAAVDRYTCDKTSGRVADDSGRTKHEWMLCWDALASTTVWQDLLYSERILIINSLVCESYEDGDDIITQGGVGNTFYIIARKGFVDVLESADGGEMAVCKTLGHGDSFGEEALLHDDDVRNSTIRAKGPVECFVLSREALQEIIGRGAAAERGGEGGNTRSTGGGGGAGGGGGGGGGRVGGDVVGGGAWERERGSDMKSKDACMLQDDLLVYLHQGWGMKGVSRRLHYLYLKHVASGEWLVAMKAVQELLTFDRIGRLILQSYHGTNAMARKFASGEKTLTTNSWYVS
jgi:hypothetical protein